MGRRIGIKILIGCMFSTKDSQSLVYAGSCLKMIPFLSISVGILSLIAGLAEAAPCTSALNVSYTAFPCEDLFKFSTGPPIMVFIFGLNIHTIGPHTTLSSFTYLILNILWKQPSASVAFVQASLLTHDGSMQHHHPAMSQIQRCPPWQESVAISALEHNPAHPCAQSRHIV